MKQTIIVETILPGVPNEIRFAKVREEGYRYVELWSVTGQDHAAIKRAADENGLEILGISGDISGQKGDPKMLNPAQKDAYRALVIQSMKDAKAVGATYLHCHSGHNYEAPGYSSEEKFAAMVLNLQYLAPIAQEYGVVLLVENCETEWDNPDYYLDCAEKVARLVRTVDHPNVRFVYDFYHEQVMRGNLIRTLKDNLDIIAYLHLSNVPHKCNLAYGEINCAAIRRAVEETGYDGPFGFEVISNGDPDETFCQIKQFFPPAY